MFTPSSKPASKLLNWACSYHSFCASVSLNSSEHLVCTPQPDGDKNGTSNVLSMGYDVGAVAKSGEGGSQIQQTGVNT